MAKTLQFRRGTTAELSSVTGAEGELFVDTTKDTVVVMDGSTAGGKPLATEAFVGTAVSNLIDAAPGTLDTLNELAAALGDDANFATSISNTVATAGSYANSAFSKANTATTDAATADQKAVTSGVYANSAYGQANTGTILAQAAFNAANTAGVELSNEPTSNILHYPIFSTSTSGSISTANTMAGKVEYNPTFNKFKVYNGGNDRIELDGSGYSDNPLLLVANNSNTTIVFHTGVSINGSESSNTKTAIFTKNEILHDSFVFNTPTITYANRNEVIGLFANTTDATPVFAGVDGSTSIAPSGQFLGNGSVSIFDVTFLAQSYGAEGSDTFDGTAVWRYEVVATRIKDNTTLEFSRIVKSNTGNSGSWSANVVITTGGFGTKALAPEVTGESGKNIYWTVDMIRQSNIRVPLAAPGNGGGK
jgi:hypothetical protein